MNAVLITLACFGVPMLLACLLYAIEYVANSVKAHINQRQVNKRLDTLR